MAMPTVLKIAGGAMALVGLILKWKELHTASAAFFWGKSYVLLVVGLALVVLGFAFRFFLFKEDESNFSSRRGPAQDA